MGIKKKTVADLEAELDRLDLERLRIRERAQQIMKERNRKIQEEQMDHWGLTAAQYQKAKALSRSSGTPAHVCLNEARKQAFLEAREARSVKTESVSIGARAKGT